MKRNHWHILKRQKGVVSVEASLVLPVVIIVILLIFEGGRLIFAYNTVAHAASEGARYAAVREDTSGLDRYLEDRIQLSGIEVTIGRSTVGKDDSAMQMVTVTVEYKFKSALTLLASIDLSSQSSRIIHH